jgi:membrane associated rhomboid family serine protease
MVTKLIIVTAGFYVLDVVIGKSHWLMENMAASRESLVKPYLWWQLLSYGFAHSTSDIWHLFWNMFGLWVFGRRIEDVYGPKEFLRIYLVSIVLGGLMWTIRAQFADAGASLVGASGAVTAVTLLFCIHFPKQIILLMMVLPVPAWVVGVMIIAGNLIGLRVSGENVAFDVHLVGAAFAIAYYRLGWNLGRWWPSFSIPVRRFNPFSRRPRLRVHRPGEEPVDDFEQLEAQADHLLEKVNRDGFDSLTSREREVLENYSRRMRNKRR